GAPGVGEVGRARELERVVVVPAQVDVVAVRRGGELVDVDVLLVAGASRIQLAAAVAGGDGGEVVPGGAAVGGAVDPDVAEIGAATTESRGVGELAVGGPVDGGVAAGAPLRERAGLRPGGAAVGRVPHDLARARPVATGDHLVDVGGVDLHRRLR